MAGFDLLLSTDTTTFKLVKYETHDTDVQLVQAIRMLLMTKPGDILGAPDFGIDLEAMVFTLALNENKMTRDIQEKIATFIPAAQEYKIDVNVSFAPGSMRDECLIDIIVNNNKQFGLYVL